MLKSRVVAFSVALSLMLAAYQLFVPSAAQAQSAAKKEQKVTATIALPGVQVETLNPYGHSTTQIYPTWETCDRTTGRMELEQKTNCSYSCRVVEQSGP